MSLTVDEFCCPFFSFMTFIVFKSPGQLFCTMSLDLDLPGVNHAWIQAVKFWRETTDKIYSSHPIILRECMRVVCPTMRMLILISYGHICQ